MGTVIPTVESELSNDFPSATNLELSEQRKEPLEDNSKVVIYPCY